MLPVDVPPVTPEADAACPTLMSALPLRAGRGGRPAGCSPTTPYAYAWGDPPVVLRLRRRPARPASSRAPRLIQINGVQWYVDTSDPDTTVWTTVDRPVYVAGARAGQPSTARSVTALTAQIAADPAVPGAHARQVSRSAGAAGPAGSASTARTSRSAAVDGAGDGGHRRR